MEPIGPRSGEVANPDILIVGSESLSDETIEAIKGLEGVRGVEPFSMVQVVIENEAINVAAVDPATYRNYTELAVADSQAVWDRIAGGELGLRKKLAKKIPQDANQFVTLGSTERRQGGAHRRPDRHGRRGRRRGQRDLDRRPRHGGRQRAPRADRRRPRP